VNCFALERIPRGSILQAIKVKGSAMLKEFTALYGLLAGTAVAGLMRVRRTGRTVPDEELPTIDVVVAARDEAENLPALVAALATQDYPAEKVAFWIVDDDSSDETYTIATAASRKDARFHAVRSDLSSPIASPKKRALDTGIRAAQGDWIVTTDADCTPKPGWLRALVSFGSPEIGLIAGYSPLFGAQSVSQWLAEGESWSSAALCAAAIGLGFPFNAFGRNLAFRRQLYLDIGGYAQHGDIASGDDDLFMQRVAAKTNWRVAFAPDSRAFVPSKVAAPERTFNTKVRHMSVGPKYAPGWVLIGLIGNILFMGLALATLLGILGLVDRSAVAKAWKRKWLFDAILIASATRVLGNPARALQAFVTASAAPLILWAIWPRALFGTVSWKGRRFERNRARSPEMNG